MKRILSIALLLSALAGAAWAASNVQAQNGGYVNAKTGAAVNSAGAALVDDAARDRDSYLEPTLIYTGTIAAGAADTTSIVNLSGYRTVALLVQCTFGSAAADSQGWQRYAFQCRYNLGGAADSLSLFSIPVQGGDSSGVFVRWTGQTPTAGVFGPDEFPVTIVNTKSHPSAQSVSTPQGRVFPILMPYSASGWPARCSFRIRNVARPKAASLAPTIRVWVMGTPL